MWVTLEYMACAGWVGSSIEGNYVARWQTYGLTALLKKRRIGVVMSQLEWGGLDFDKPTRDSEAFFKGLGNKNIMTGHDCNSNSPSSIAWSSDLTYNTMTSESKCPVPKASKQSEIRPLSGPKLALHFVQLQLLLLCSFLSGAGPIFDFCSLKCLSPQLWLSDILYKRLFGMKWILSDRQPISRWWSWGVGGYP